MAKRERSKAIQGYDARAATVKARNLTSDLPGDIMSFVYQSASGNHKRAEEILRDIARKTQSIGACLDGALDGQFEGLLDKVGEN